MQLFVTTDTDEAAQASQQGEELNLPQGLKRPHCHWQLQDGPEPEKHTGNKVKG